MITDNMIDDLGIINQQIAELEATARKLKQALIARGVGKYNGMDFVAEVQHYDRATIDPALVRKLADAEFVSSVTQIKAVDAVVVKRVQL
jgi:PHP family Zn ribbon phosphoesterase